MSEPAATAMPASLRSTTRNASPLVVLVTLLVTASASAAPTGFSVNRFEPSERGSHWFANESLDLQGGARPAFGLVLDYAHRPLAIYDGNGDVRTTIVGDTATAHVGGAIVLAERIRLGASLPVALYTDGDGGTLRGVTYAAPRDSTAVGDLRLAVDARIAGRHDEPITFALGARFWAPTGATSSYTGDGGVRFGPRALVAGSAGRLAYAAQVGVLFRDPKTKSFADTAIGHELVYSAAAGLRLLDGGIVIGPELHGSTVLEDAFSTRASPLEILLGGHLRFRGGLRFGAGVGTGLVSGLGTPGVRGLASLEWSPDVLVDTDGDGIHDEDDACRSERGPRSNDRALNGCPPPPLPPDTDGDEIPDSEDACMDVRGVRTNDPKTNGCADSDQDGILDPHDACPRVPGPPSTDPSRNGCPDSDGDGVLDRDDACQDIPGLKTNNPETNGCPEDPDRDRDGIPNARDACPDEAGIADLDPRKNGCPKTFSSGEQLRTKQVRFKPNAATLDLAAATTTEALQAIVTVLKEHPEIAVLRVDGHTNNRGAPKWNKKLSELRAAEVVKWLVAHGVEAGRLVSGGFGMDRPIEANDTEEGRALNDRVEFRVETVGE